MHFQRGSWKRRITQGLSVLSAVIVMGSVVGVAYEHTVASRARSRCPMVGRLIDVGGYRLHLNCSGSGGLTVVFDSGALESSQQWDLVQPQIAKTTRSCSFDRAGLGWSDRSATRPSFAENARDLHGLLRKAGIPPPYILVVHSNGGLDMQTFAYESPDDVIGMALDDSVHADETIRFRARFATPAWEKAIQELEYAWEWQDSSAGVITAEPVPIVSSLRTR